jgi:ATP-dependent DNA ligase
MIYDILNSLASTSARTTKEQILKDASNNEVLKQVVFLALDPFTQFYIRKIPSYKPAAANQADSLSSVLDSLYLLSTRQVTGNAAIELLAKLLGSLTADDAQVLERVISKDLKCGVSEATVNKIWPKLIPTYPCMLASAYDDKLVAKIQWPAVAQLKLDGMRFNAIVRNGKVEFRSRNGKELDLLGNLEAEFLKVAGKDECVFDGELCVVDDSGKFLPRQTGNGILSKAQKGTLSASEASMIRATVWDVISYEAFHSGHSSMTYRRRFNVLRTTVGLAKVDKIAIVETHEVYNIADVRVLFDKALAEGQEGIILKDFNSPWEDKRAKHMIKFKGELECDLKCVGWEEGTGKNVGRLGALVLESADGVVKVSVGTGFTDEHRSTIGRDVVGKIIAIKYNGRIKDVKSGIESLFLPVFIEIRDDKNTADKSKDIK